MTNAELKKLRQFYHSLRGLSPIFDEQKGNIDHPPVVILQDEIAELLKEFPGQVPPLNLDRFYSHGYEGVRYYDSGGIRAYLATAISRLEIAIEEETVTPVTEQKTFSFIRDSAIRSIVERDFAEAQRAYISECWKSVIILSGGMVEAILADLLQRNATLALKAKTAPKQSDIGRWDLADLIKVAVELKLVTPGVEKLSNPIREYRNLVHPGNEVRTSLHFGTEEAKIALEVLNIVHRDLASK